VAKKVYLIRHAKAEFKPGYDIWQLTSKLIEPAESQAKTAAEYFGSHNITFSKMYSSSLTRAGQTAYLVANHLGVDVIEKREELGPGEPEEWCKLYDEWKRAQPDPENVPNLGGPECLALWPGLCKREGERVFGAIVEIAKETKDGESVAAFSHNPLLRLAQFFATGSCEGPEIKYCQSICFIFDGNRFVGCEEHLF
jgi:broad specificity phosphatase PhoE